MIVLAPGYRDGRTVMDLVEAYHEACFFMLYRGRLQGGLRGTRAALGAIVQAQAELETAIERLADPTGKIKTLQSALYEVNALAIPLRAVLENPKNWADKAALDLARRLTETVSAAMATDVEG